MDMSSAISKVHLPSLFYDGTTLVQPYSLGNESVAVVEYAMYQKVPHEKRKADAKVGTIESGVMNPPKAEYIITHPHLRNTDDDFISFLEALNKPMEPTPDINELVAQGKLFNSLVLELPTYHQLSAAITTEPSSTPLLDALKAAKEASTIKGYHSHYREQSSQPRKQDLEDDDAFNRNAPLLLKNQQDSAASGGPEPPTREVERGKEKEKEGDRKERDEVGSGGKKGKNRPKPVNGPKSPKPVPSAPQPPTSSAPTRPTAESSRPRPTARMNAHVLAALGATTLARGGRKGGRQREISGSTPNADTSTQSTSVPTPAPVTSTPGPITAPPPPLPAGVIAISPPLKPPKSGRGKGRSRGGPSNEAGGGPAPTTPSNPADMPRIDDPNQALPPATPVQRGRGGNPGRGRGGRGRGRGRGGGGGGGARVADDQPSTSTG